MAISALSSNLVNDLSQQQNPFRQVRQDFKQLASALQSGSLSHAQSAYSNIQQVLQASEGLSGASAGSSPLQNDFAALGQALQSGDLSQAQSDFAQLQSDGAPKPGQNPPPAQDQYLPSSQTTSLEQQARQDYRQLASGLQTGNVAQAQSSFASLQQVLQTQAGDNTNSTTSTSADPISNDLSTLGQALSSDSLTQAQSAFSRLQNDVSTAEQANSSAPQTLATTSGTAVEGHHHHHHHGGSGESESANSTATATSSSDTNSSVSIYG